MVRRRLPLTPWSRQTPAQYEARLTADARLFQGIPYAAPPVGQLRWASPQRAASWRGIRDATKPGNRCAQAEGLIDPASTTEDCLYLNVTTPRQSSGHKLPVMVWIHGNGFISGAGSLYDAQQLANSGQVVVVSPNYRLGIFGFLAHPALDHGQARQLSGNFGIEDQQAALRWVKRNAAAFGGDPGNVTIFGESAGGTSVCSHLVAPGSAGLFQKAIVQSAQCTGRKWSPGPPTWFPLPRSEREQHGLEVAAKVGCTDPGTAAACLRGKRTEKLSKWSDDGVGSGPTVGGGVLPLSPDRAFATGRFNHVPIIQGTTRDEHRLFTAAIETATGQVTTPASYREEVHTLFNQQDAQRILARYPVAQFHSAGEALSAVVTDWAWGCTVLDRDRALAAQTPLYAFEFADESAPWFTTLPRPNFPTGAFHGAELQYLFADEQLPGPGTPAQEQLAATMMSLLDPVRTHRKPERSRPAAVAAVPEQEPRPVTRSGQDHLSRPRSGTPVRVLELNRCRLAEYRDQDQQHGYGEDCSEYAEEEAEALPLHLAVADAAG